MAAPAREERNYGSAVGTLNRYVYAAPTAPNIFDTCIQARRLAVAIPYPVSLECRAQLFDVGYPHVEVERGILIDTSKVLGRDRTRRCELAILAIEFSHKLLQRPVSGHSLIGRVPAPEQLDRRTHMIHLRMALICLAAITILEIDKKSPIVITFRI